MLRHLAPLCVVLAWAVVPPEARAYDIYDVDFEAPFHTAGLPPALDVPTSQPRLGPLSLSPTNPLVIAGMGDLDGQVLELKAGGSLYPEYSNLVFALGFSAPIYRIDFDLFVDSLSVDSDPVSTYGFTLGLATTQTVLSMRFQEDGVIRTDQGASTTVADVGTFAVQTRYHVRALVDRTAGHLDYFLQGQPLASSDIVPFSYLTGVNVEIQDRYGGTRVGVDNVRISSVPEPGTASLVGLGLALLSAARGRVRRRGR